MYLKYLKIAFKCFFLLLYCLYALCTYFISTCPRCLRSLEKLFGLVFPSCPHTLVVETEPPDPLDNGNPQVLSVQYGFFLSAEILPNTAPGASSCPFHSPFSSCFSLHVHHTILSLLQQAFHSCLVRGVTPSTPSPSLALLLKRHFFLPENERGNMIVRIHESESEVAQSCPTHCDPMDCTLPGSTVHGILQARILEWIVISSSRRSSQRRDGTPVSCHEGGFFTI